MDLIGAIKSRRSIRKFQDKNIEEKTIETILDCGRWAPSGLNNQPWNFLVINDQEQKNTISQFTKYGHTIIQAPVCIAVFLDTNSSYNRTKDVQAIGACIQNMLLCIHSLNLGAVWLGEILNQKEKVNEALAIDENFELMAMIAIGDPAEKPTSQRKDLESLLL